MSDDVKRTTVPLQPDLEVETAAKNLIDAAGGVSAGAQALREQNSIARDARLEANTEEAKRLRQMEVNAGESILSATIRHTQEKAVLGAKQAPDYRGGAK